MCDSNKNRNYLKDLRDLLCQIRTTQMEPEYCNISCPPLGCPRGPCPGMCLDERGCVDPCCYSTMPKPCSSPPSPPQSSCPRHKSKHMPCGSRRH